MRKIYALLSLAFLLCSISANAEKVYNLQVVDYSGAVTQFALTDEPVISIADNQLVVTSKTSTLTVDMDEVKYYKFNSSEVDGIDEITMQGFSIDDSNARVYTIDGTPVASTSNLSNLPKGIYILKTKSQSFKFINK